MVPMELNSELANSTLGRKNIKKRHASINKVHKKTIQSIVKPFNDYHNCFNFSMFTLNWICSITINLQSANSTFLNSLILSSWLLQIAIKHVHFSSLVLFHGTTYKDWMKPTLKIMFNWRRWNWDSRVSMVFERERYE